MSQVERFSAAALLLLLSAGCDRDEVEALIGELENKTVEPGSLAGLALSKNILAIPAEEILTTEVETTILGGKILYSRAESRSR
jgi:predicted amidohydrolase YtcJ